MYGMQLPLNRELNGQTFGHLFTQYKPSLFHIYPSDGFVSSVWYEKQQEQGPVLVKRT